MKKTSLLLFLALCAPVIAENKFEGALKPFMGEPEFEIQQVFKGGRFPNLAVATDGTVLAIFGKDGVSLKRSEDGGKTWGDPIVIANSGFMGGGGDRRRGHGRYSGVYRKEPSAGDADDPPQQGSRKDLGRAGGHRDQARQPGATCHRCT